MTDEALPAFDPKEFLSSVNHGRTVMVFKPNEQIFVQGDPAEAVFYIQKGNIKIVVTSEQGKEGVVGVLRDGEFFGEGCLVGQPARLAAAVAVTECEVMCIEKAEMVRALHAEPALSEVFMAHLLTRNGRIEADLVDQLFNSSEKRLARAAVARKFRQGRRASADHWQSEPRDVGCDRRHHALAH